MRTLTVIILFAFLAACATPVANSDLRGLSEAGVLQFEDGFSIFHVPSSGGITDATFIAMSKSGPSAVSQQLSEIFRSAKAEELQLVVGGANSAKTTIVVEGAIKLLGAESWENLHVLFVGSKSDEERVRDSVEQAGGTLYVPHR